MLATQFVLFVSVISLLWLFSDSVDDKSWDLLYLLKKEKGVSLTNEFTMLLKSSSDYSQMSLSPKSLFPTNALPKTFLTIVKLKFFNRIQSLGTIFSIVDPDNEKRLSLTIKANSGIIDKTTLHVLYHPLNGEKVSRDIILPFGKMIIWTFGLSITEGRITVYTDCEDTKRSFGYQFIKIAPHQDKPFFPDGAVLNLFHDGNGVQKLEGEIYELIFSNHIGNLLFLCPKSLIDGSGSKKIKRDNKKIGNVLMNPQKEQLGNSDDLDNVLSDEMITNGGDIIPSTSNVNEPKETITGRPQKEINSEIDSVNATTPFTNGSPRSSTKKTDPIMSKSTLITSLSNKTTLNLENNDNINVSNSNNSTIIDPIISPTKPDKNNDTRVRMQPETMSKSAMKMTKLDIPKEVTKETEMIVPTIPPTTTAKVTYHEVSTATVADTMKVTYHEMSTTTVAETPRKTVTPQTPGFSSTEASKAEYTSLEINNYLTKGYSLNNSVIQKWIQINNNKTSNDPINTSTEYNRCKVYMDQLLNMDNCEELRQLRLTVPKTGEKGDKGAHGERGEKGEVGPRGMNGSCDMKLCESASNARGTKGDKGDQGTCEKNRCAGIKGEKGTDGSQGDKGVKGEMGSSTDMNIELIKHLIATLIPTEIETMMRNIKGTKGDPGECKTNTQSSNNRKSNNGARRDFQENINIGYGSLVFENKESLEKVSHQLPLGSMVFLLKSDTFLVKVDNLNNVWRSIGLDSRSKDWELPLLQTTPRFPSRAPVYFNGFSKKLYLVALSIPTLGDLKSTTYQPGGYSGASFQCQQNGDIFGYGRLMHPLVNTDMFNMKYVIHDMYKNTPIYNSRDQILSNDFTSLLSSKDDIQNDILDFDRRSISDNVMSSCVWIGKDPIPEYRDYQQNAELKCNNWMSRHPLSQALVSTLRPSKPLLSDDNLKPRACSLQCHILCIQTEPHI